MKSFVHSSRVVLDTSRGGTKRNRKKEFSIDIKTYFPTLPSYAAGLESRRRKRVNMTNAGESHHNHASRKLVMIVVSHWLVGCITIGMIHQGAAFHPLLKSRRYFPATKKRELHYSTRRSAQTLFMTNSAYDHQEDEEEEDDEDDDDEPPQVDVSKFNPPSATTTMGLNRGRSAPSQRKALGASGTGTTSVYVCTNCGCESVKWMGRCPTCRQWNTLQEFAVRREERSSTRPSIFGGGDGRNFSPGSAASAASSWLDGVSSSNYGMGGGSGAANFGDYYAPVRVTDILKQQKSSPSGNNDNRLIVPDDEELNNVLGGGIMKGSLVLVGGEPGVGKSTLLLQTAGRVASQSTPTVGIGMGSGSDAPTRTTGQLQGPVWYVSGEETMEQIASRADRLGIHEAELFLYTETQVDVLAEQVVQLTESAATASLGRSVDSENENADAATRSLLRRKPPCLVMPGEPPPQGVLLKCENALASCCAWPNRQAFPFSW
jgi:AAA domain/Rubredoxin metal binding domain